MGEENVPLSSVETKAPMTYHLWSMALLCLCIFSYVISTPNTCLNLRNLTQALTFLPPWLPHPHFPFFLTGAEERRGLRSDLFFLLFPL